MNLLKSQHPVMLPVVHEPLTDAGERGCEHNYLHFLLWI